MRSIQLLRDDASYSQSSPLIQDLLRAMETRSAGAMKWPVSSVCVRWRSMDDFVFEFHQVEMRNIELPHGADRQLKGLVAVGPGRGAHLLAELSQRAEDARPVEPLPFAMF